MTPPHQEPPRSNRAQSVPNPSSSTWGLGDVAAGILAAQVLSILVVGVVFAATNWSDTAEIPLWATGLLQVPLWCGLAGSVLYAARAKGNGVVAEFGLAGRVWDAPLGLALGTLCQLVVLPLLYWPVLSLLGRSTEDLAEPAEDLASRADGNAGWLLLALMVVVAAPLVEELFYRGLLLGALRKRGWGPWPAIIVSSAVFGAMHFQPLQFLGLFTFGVVLALLRTWQGRLGGAIWAHVGFNATTVVSLYLQA